MIERNDPRIRVYPTCCTSAFCGKTAEDCPWCRNKPIKAEFEAWVDAHGAIVEDTTWSPLVYTATR